MRSRMPFTSRPASRVEYCLARVTASSITALGGISPVSSSPRSASSRASSSSTLESESSVPTSGGLLVDAVEDAVHQSSGLPGRILLGEGDGLVDHGARRDLAGVELVDRDAQDVPLDRSEAVGGPARLLGGGGDAPVQLGSVADDRVGNRLRVRVDLALVELAGRPLGDVPLVEERQRGAAGLAAT